MYKLLPALLLSSLLSGPTLAAGAEDSLFKMFDTNNDGQLQLKEFRGDTQMLDDACSQVLLKQIEPEVAQLFQQLDVDGNERVSRQEFREQGNRLYNSYLKNEFNKLDEDNNNRVSRAEYNRGVQRDVDDFNAKYGNHKMPGACEKDAEAWRDYYATYPAYLRAWFDYLDADENSSLTLAEFKGEHLWP